MPYEKQHIHTGPNPVVCQKWREIEGGWDRPDGFTLHMCRAGLKAHLAQHWDSLPDTPPQEYTAPSGEPYVTGISSDMLEVLVSNGGVSHFSPNYEHPQPFGEEVLRHSFRKSPETPISIVRIAELIARSAHEGQKYGEHDYADGHLKSVVELVADLGYDEEYQATAWLHDVLEDNPRFTPEYLINLGVPEQIVEALILLDKTRYSDHETYLQGISRNPLATVVKLADSLVNLGNTTLHSSDVDKEKRRERITEYTHNVNFLLRFV